MLGYIVKLLKSLNANANPGDIAHAVSLGIILGFMPKNNLLWYLLFVFFLFVRINKGAYFLFMILASLIAPVLDPLFDKTGYAVLLCQPLEQTFSTLIDIPFVGFTKFNNSIVMGSFIWGIIVYIPFYILARLFVKAWRSHLAPAFAKSRLLRALYNIPLLGKIIELASGAN